MFECNLTVEICINGICIAYDDSNFSSNLKDNILNIDLSSLYRISLFKLSLPAHLVESYWLFFVHVGQNGDLLWLYTGKSMNICCLSLIWTKVTNLIIVTSKFWELVSSAVLWRKRKSKIKMKTKFNALHLYISSFIHLDY